MVIEDFIHSSEKLLVMLNREGKDENITTDTSEETTGMESEPVAGKNNSSELPKQVLNQ